MKRPWKEAPVTRGRRPRSRHGTGATFVLGEADARDGRRYRLLDTGQIVRVDEEARRKLALRRMGLSGRQRRLAIKAIRRRVKADGVRRVT